MTPPPRRRRSVQSRKAEALSEISVAYGALRNAEAAAPAGSPLALIASAAADSLALAIGPEPLAAITVGLRDVRMAEQSIRAVMGEPPQGP